MTRPSLALIAHDEKKAVMTAWATRYRDRLAQYNLYATGTTGGRIREACPELQVTLLKSGPLGGDQQVGALICESKIDCLIFFVDPLSPHPHDVDVKALTRLALVYDIPMALNPTTADYIMRGLATA
ncbi:methylglyoxal synthase [Methylovirgula sp. 4M-Z18]|uniref:methylglyoxal synthase n=1 Tax=Methylovirgula sp. 4M-Z18 TaxID=2293567 RepID=UPI000E2EAB28|nr:methylglyoxal synthase [Methylovirgula sp. 4M-Z18]RFB81345.1 methylglyoxal synthase [Methylovirgula sp. 4M-Z18]